MFVIDTRSSMRRVHEGVACNGQLVSSLPAPSMNLGDVKKYIDFFGAPA